MIEAEEDDYIPDNWKGTKGVGRVKGMGKSQGHES